MRWYVPSWNGDFRLESLDDKRSALTIMQPTAYEVKLLRSFLKKARARNWTTEDIAAKETIDIRIIRLSATVAETAPVLVGTVKPTDRTLTAVVFRNGQLEVAETVKLEPLAKKAEKEDATAAVSVARPTLSCPACEPGAVEPASEVLLSFLTPTEHADWAAKRAIIVQGGCSGHRYLLAHRNSDTARRIGRICYDLTDQLVIHFHDWTVPPEEEILAAKLILEHREPWLRNEATVQWMYPDGRWSDLGYMRFKNPFGNQSDGTLDAAISKSVGVTVLELAALLQG
jgi:hypothetical protein